MGPDTGRSSGHLSGRNDDARLPASSGVSPAVVGDPQSVDGSNVSSDTQPSTRTVKARVMAMSKIREAMLG